MDTQQSIDTSRVALLSEYLQILTAGPVLPEVFDRYRPVIENATAQEVNSALETLLAPSGDIALLEVPVARFIRSVGKALEAQTLPSYPRGSLLASLSEENDAIAAYLVARQEHNRRISAKEESALGQAIAEIGRYTDLEAHYTRLQNELFPLLERSGVEHACTKLMWTLQDEVLAAKKALMGFDGLDMAHFWRLYGRYYVLAGLLSFRERYILYPIAVGALPTDGDQAIRQSAHGLFSTITGSLSHHELERIFMTLPFDIAFIGADDRVKFYSDPPHRIFARSPQVVGRLVQNCHPPKSVGTVEEILTSFKEGRADSAEFYLVFNGSFVHIMYYAVRSADGTYLGTMEVSQDATHLRSLTGEKRLL